MAAIEKMYMTPREGVEFVKWVKNVANARFKGTFTDCPDELDSWLCFNADEWLVNPWTDENDEVCVAHFTEGIDIWLAKQEDLPESAKRCLCWQYALKTDEDWKRFTERPLTTIDNRPIGKHYKIMSQSGRTSKKGLFDAEITNWLYRDRWQRPKPQNAIDSVQWYTEEEQRANKHLTDQQRTLLEDMWWYLPEFDKFTNTSYDMKTCVGFEQDGWMPYYAFNKQRGRKYRYAYSLKAFVKHLVKKGFPIGTLITICDYYNHGMTVVVKITK